jgi:hypothetical protein
MSEAKKPDGWLIPSILTFKDAIKTSCPPEHQATFEGTVAWRVSMWGEGPTVTDKHGATHSPKPLYDTPQEAKINADLLEALEWFVEHETRLHGFDSAFYEAGCVAAEAAIAKAQPAAKGV